VLLDLTDKPNSKQAIVLSRQSPSEREFRLCRILEFFGVPYETHCLSDLGKTGTEFSSKLEPYAILGPVDAFDEILKAGEDGARLVGSAGAVYVYSTEDRSFCEKALESLLEFPISYREKPYDESVLLTVTSDFPDLTGPMTGVELSTSPGQPDFAFLPAGEGSKFISLITAGRMPVFSVSRIGSTPIFFAASDQIVDLDAPITEGYYDIKKDFYSAVPLVMFLKYVFAQVIWQPVEHGACLIIDDPLLKSRYGCCDFRQLLHLMKTHRFTTNIAFIPWNWRRTSKKQASFFRREVDHFSISIHGCDHIAAEFGFAGVRELSAKARLAQTRMRAHQDRSGIRHEPVMVFPQGVFSESCPEVLKQAGYIAAVNTEVSPAGNTSNKTQLRDVWDTAITRFVSFPIFTRRYAHHGLENFAFDLLLGKPCLVVAHHEFFKNKGQALLELVESLSSLRCNLQWRSLGEVLRRACRHRIDDSGIHEYRMYAQEVRIENESPDMAIYHVRKREDEPSLIKVVEAGQDELEWKASGGYIEFAKSIPGGEGLLIRFVCKTAIENNLPKQSIKYQLYVAARRVLSELRDERMFFADQLKRMVGIERRSC
jgi:hypothetical protein